MSDRIHNCPKCGKQWHCVGCFTKEETRPCDDCMSEGFVEGWKACFEHFKIEKLKLDAEYEAKKAEALVQALERIRDKSIDTMDITLAEQVLKAYKGGES